MNSNDIPMLERTLAKLIDAIEGLLPGCGIICDPSTNDILLDVDNVIIGVTGSGLIVNGDICADNLKIGTTGATGSITINGLLCIDGDIKFNGVTGGVIGPTGPTGPAGPPGVTGADGGSGLPCFPNSGATVGTLVTIGFDEKIKVPITDYPIWEWAETADGFIGDNSQALAIAADCCGNSYIAGIFNNFTITFGNITITNGDSSDEIFVAKLDTDGNWIWAKHVENVGTLNIRVREIAVDCCGNAYIIGNAQDTMTFDNNITLTGFANNDVFVAKIDTNGNWLWADKTSGATSDVGFGITTDKCGNVYVTGYFESGTFTLGDITLSNLDDEDVFIAKLNTDGKWLWAKTAQGTDNDRGTSVAVDCCGNVYLTGSYNSSNLSFDSNLSLTNPSGTNIFVAKLDTDGNWLWATDVDTGSTSDVSPDVALDCCGNAYIYGSFTGTVGFNNITVTSSGGIDAFIAKINSQGNWIWVNSVMGSSLHEIGSDIVVDCCGNSYVSGYFGSTVITFGLTTLTMDGDGDSFVAKMDKDGNWLWAVKPTNPDTDQNLGIALDCCGNVYISGVYSDTITFDTDISLTSSGIFDLFVAKLFNDACFPGIMQADDCVAFKGMALATNDTTDNFPIKVGKKYYYDRNTNKLTLACNNKNNCKCCCEDLSTCGKVYAVGMPDNKVCIR